MRKFGNVAAQGEVFIRRLDKRPNLDDYKAVSPEAGRFIVGHSETGHHHVLDCEGVTLLERKKVSQGMRILLAIVEKPVALEHLRPFDTHDPIMLEPGEYELRTGREFDPFEEEIRRQSD